MFQMTKQNPRRIRKLKSAVSLFVRGENGIGALMAVLTLLLFGALILTPLLYFMVTGHKGGQVVQERTTEFYAADAGVEEAIWAIQYGPLSSDNIDWASYPENTIDYRTTDNALQMNYRYGPGDAPVGGHDVTISVTNEYPGATNTVYRIVSTATCITPDAAGEYRSTTIDTRITPFWGFQGNFFNNAITSDNNVILALDPKSAIYGDIECSLLFSLTQGSVYGNVHCGTLDLPKGATINGNADYYDTYRNLPLKGIVTGTSTAFVPAPTLSATWPSYAYLDNFYRCQTLLGGTDPSKYPAIVIEGGSWGPGVTYKGPGVTGDFVPGELPPTSGTGYDVRITGTAILNGTVVVNGDLSFANGSTLNLNGQTMYVRGMIKPGGTNLTLSGTGALISIGDLSFKPSFKPGGSEDPAWITHYDGSAWSTTGVNPDETYLLDLNDVWGYRSGGVDTVFAVGNSGEVETYKTGDLKWTEIPRSVIGAAIPTLPDLNGIWGNASGTNIYVVGDDGNILRYCPTSTPKWWKDAQGSALSSYNLNGVWGTSDDNIYAVGDHGTILHYNGAIWDPVDVSSLTMSNLNGVWGSSDGTLFAVGAGGTVLQRTPDGNWTSLTDDALQTNSVFKAVWGSGPGDVYVVGGNGATFGEPEDGVIMHYDGVSWEDMPLPPTNIDGTTANLNDVWGIVSGTDRYVYAVGNYGVILRKVNSGDWSQMTTSTYRDLNGIWGSAWNDVYVVGSTTQNFVFIMSVDGKCDFAPDQRGGQCLMSVAGGGEVTLGPNQLLVAPQKIGNVNFPKYRWMRISTYVIRQGKSASAG